MKQLKVKITFIEPVLGSLNNNPEIMREFTAAKAGDPKKADEEVAAIMAAGSKLKQNDGTSGGGEVKGEAVEGEDIEETIEKQTTVFPRNPDGTLFCWDYQWRGFFKEAFSIGTELAEHDKQAKEAMGSLSKWKAKGAVDSLLFVAERRIAFIGPDGQPIKEVSQLERPLRATTMRGERVCLARSEIVPAGTSVIFTLNWLEAPNKGAKPSKSAITEKAIAWALGYGALKGFGQWRGGGYGRFSGEFLGSLENVRLKLPEIPAEVGEKELSSKEE